MAEMIVPQAAPAPDEPALAEPALRYFLAGGLIGVPTRDCYLRAIGGIGLWLLGPPLLAGLLGRVGARPALHRLERWWARRVAAHLQIRLDRAGLHHLAPGEQYIVAPLHEGFADVLALLHLPLDLRFAARDELFGWRILGPYLSRAAHIEVAPERGSRSYRQLLRAGRRVFGAGESLVIFPQGTILGIESDFMAGAFALAQALERPILPVVLTGSHRVWEHPYTARLRYGQRISMHVLPPIPVDVVRAQPADELRVATRRAMKALALSDAVAAPRRFVPQRDGYWDDYAYQIDPDFPALAAEIAHRRGLLTAKNAKNAK